MSKRTRLDTARKLQAIERARRSAAEAELADARSGLDRAEEARADAAEALAAAENAWVERLDGGLLNLELQRLFSTELLRREQALGLRSAENDEAASRFERYRSGWIELEASVRSGDRLLGRWRHELHRRAAERADQALSDRTSWKWFMR